MRGVIDLDPGKEFDEINRFWQGCPTIARTRGGRLFAGWYTGGTREPSLKNYNLLVKSDDNGRSWSRPVLVIPSLEADAVCCIDIQLFIDPEYRMWIFWTQRDLHYAHADERHLSTYAVICDDPDAEVLTLSEPRYIAPGFLRCQPTVLNDGRWLLCAYDFQEGNYHYSESKDNGLSWERKEGALRCCPRNFDEPMILERRDGSLWFLARTAVGVGFLAEAFSFDGGATWENSRLTDIADPSARFFLRRLRSGRVLLVKNDSRGQSKSVRERYNMTAFLSEDDGRSWCASLLIDPGDSSYPDAAEDENGNIYLVHDRGRYAAREIVFSRFTEEDILNGRLTDHSSFVNQIISKAPAVPVDPALYAAQKAEDDAMIARYFS